MSSLVVFSVPKTGAGRVLPLRESNDFQSRSWLRPATVRCGLRLEVQESGNHAFMLGMGFVGQFLGHQLKEEGWKVSGTCLSEIKKKKLEGSGFEIFIYSLEDYDSSRISTSYGFHHQESLFTLQDATHLLISIPPSVLHFHRDLIWNRLKNGRVHWLCYLSSTSVYGDHGGYWVDEDTPPKPENELAVARLEAENAWINLGCDLGVHVYVLRLGGIYGPGRSALDTIIKQGPLSKDQQRRQHRRYPPRIHVADVCQAIRASMNKSSTWNVFNIIDDDPAPRSEVFSYARSLVMQRWPDKLDGISVDQETLNQHAQTGELIEEKRVSNNRMKSELGVELLHPNYRSGLESIARGYQLR
ncbi:uncharacterized protein LOC116264784 isoform X2 [Nymphaea colorata]|uniref:uncharacterized protein LOC116264784 isoform X2 n=1 Tax=Nymphaea colorata TaxID=210225 RepID=UPI00129D5E97|nr:uncharacterized protein LOC116264784 isoform X2 [Nymphaea colorata]